jgi:hypothetical protein
MKSGTNMPVAAAQRDYFQLLIRYQPLDGARATAGDVCLAELAATPKVDGSRFNGLRDCQLNALNSISPNGGFAAGLCVVH